MGGSEDVSRPREAVSDQIETAHGSLLQPEENAFKRWVLINGNRGVVAAVSLLIVGLGFVVFGAVWTVQITDLFTETDVVQTLLFTLLSGTILLVSIAVSINAVVLSQELTALGEQEEQIDDVLSFRTAIQDLTDADASPAQPAEFLRVILRAAKNRAQELRDATQDADPELRRQADVLIDDITNQVDGIEERLTNSEFGTSDVLMSGLDYDYSWQVYACRRIKTQHADRLTESQIDTLDSIIETLKQFSTGREYFKTLYFKRELADLSRWLLAVAFPTIVFLSYSLLALRAGLVPELSLFGIPSLALFVGLSYIVGLGPYALFTAYVFRSATISKRTLAAGPFILQDQDRRGKIDWDAENIADE